MAAGGPHCKKEWEQSHDTKRRGFTLRWICRESDPRAWKPGKLGCKLTPGGSDFSRHDSECILRMRVERERKSKNCRKRARKDLLPSKYMQRLWANTGRHLFPRPSPRRITKDARNWICERAERFANARCWIFAAPRGDFLWMHTNILKRFAHFKCNSNSFAVPISMLSSFVCVD